MIEVTEADREAAIAYLKGKGPWKAEEIGLMPDDDYIIQAFATHRIEAVNAERDRIVALLRSEQEGRTSDNYDAERLVLANREEAVDE